MIPDPGTKIPHAAGHLSPAAKVLKATCSGAHTSQLENPWAAIKDHICYNKDPTCCNSRPDTAREINQECFINVLYVPGFPCGSAGKESTCNEGDLGSIPGLGRSPGEGKGYPLQYSGLENPMDYTVHGVAKSRTQLSGFHFHFMSHTKSTPLQAECMTLSHFSKARGPGALDARVMLHEQTPAWSVFCGDGAQMN